MANALRRRGVAVNLQFDLTMDRACIALVDARRARFFTFSRVRDAAGSHEELVEQPELVNDDQPLSQPAVGFARAAMATLRELLDAHPAKSVVVCTSPTMLGTIRAAAPGLLPDDAMLDILRSDLGVLSPADVLTELATSGALAPHAARPGW